MSGRGTPHPLMDLHLCLVLHAVPAYIDAVESPVAVVTRLPSSLHCPAGGDPAPTVTWTFGSQTFPPASSTPRITVTNGNQSISFTETAKSDEGVYVCTASNALLSVSMAISLVVYSELAGATLPWQPHPLHSAVPHSPAHNCHLTNIPTTCGGQCGPAGLCRQWRPPTHHILAVE